jgi:hypothetical protein
MSPLGATRVDSDPASRTPRDAAREGLAEPASASRHDPAKALTKEEEGVPKTGYEASIAALQALCVSNDFAAWEEAVAGLSELRQLLKTGMQDGSLTDRMRAKYASKELETMLGKGGELSRLAFMERMARGAKKAPYPEQEEDPLSPNTLKMLAGDGARFWTLDRTLDHRAGDGEGGGEALSDRAARILSL